MVQPLDVPFRYVPDVRGQALIQRFQGVTFQDKVLVPATLGRIGLRVLLQFFDLVPHVLRPLGRYGESPLMIRAVEAVADLGRSRSVVPTNTTVQPPPVKELARGLPNRGDPRSFGAEVDKSILAVWIVRDGEQLRRSRFSKVIPEAHHGRVGRNVANPQGIVAPVPGTRPALPRAHV